MHKTSAEVFHLASTRVHDEQLYEYLAAIGADNWTTDAHSAGELLAEIAGRVCYRAFAPGLNKNVTRVREGNSTYLKNILASKHGSVLEHASDTYLLYKVSRVLTHELVRHRAGCAYSQESLRYVRLDDLGYWFPWAFAGHDRSDEIQKVFEGAIGGVEDAIRQIANMLDLDELSFELKKKFTSAMRRLAPMGLSTTIVITANHRAWRHLIELRTSRHAEEEIRLVFSKIFEIQAKLYPAIYQDAFTVPINGLPEVRFENSKI